MISTKNTNAANSNLEMAAFSTPITDVFFIRCFVHALPDKNYLILALSIKVFDCTAFVIFKLKTRHIKIIFLITKIPVSLPYISIGLHSISLDLTTFPLATFPWATLKIYSEMIIIKTKITKRPLRYYTLHFIQVTLSFITLK